MLISVLPDSEDHAIVLMKNIRRGTIAEEQKWRIDQLKSIFGSHLQVLCDEPRNEYVVIAKKGVNMGLFGSEFEQIYRQGFVIQSYSKSGEDGESTFRLEVRPGYSAYKKFKSSGTENEK